MSLLSPCVALFPLGEISRNFTQTKYLFYFSQQKNLKFPFFTSINPTFKIISLKILLNLYFCKVLIYCYISVCKRLISLNLHLFDKIFW